MASLSICTKCNGTKEVRSIGYVMTKCSLCDGLGKIFDKPITSKIPSLDKEVLEETAIKIHKRRGRPPKAAGVV